MKRLADRIGLVILSSALVCTLGIAVSQAADPKPASTFSQQEARARMGEPTLDGDSTLQLETAKLSTHLSVAANLESAFVYFNSEGSAALKYLPSFNSIFLERRAAKTAKGDFVFFTLENDLQTYAEAITAKSRAPHVAMVAMDPSTGKVLAVSQRSISIQNLALHSGFPAASLFKLVTAAAALEKGRIQPHSKVYFRGGTYVLNEWNYIPDAKRDRFSMTAAEALGKSCNPVFGHIGLSCGKSLLSSYAGFFGYNHNLRFDAPLEQSTASVPFDDYGLSLTAAGFGDVTLSPIHAAAIAAGLANGGQMVKPYLIDRIISPAGSVKYRTQPEILQRMVSPQTARTLLEMMEYTTTIGTSRRQFSYPGRSVLGGIRVAAKTGTLKGSNPQGITNWFVAAAPIEKPRVALAVVVMNPGGPSGKASFLGRQFLQRFFGQTPTDEVEPPAKRLLKARKRKNPAVHKHIPIKKTVVKHAPKKKKKRK